MKHGHTTPTNFVCVRTHIFVFNAPTTHSSWRGSPKHTMYHPYAGISPSFHRRRGRELVLTEGRGDRWSGCRKSRREANSKQHETVNKKMSFDRSRRHLSQGGAYGSVPPLSRQRPTAHSTSGAQGENQRKPCFSLGKSKLKIYECQFGRKHEASCRV